MPRRIIPWLWIFLLAGCMEGQKPAPLQRTPPSLYQRLGGEDGIRKVVDDFVANVVADKRIKERHKKHFQEGDVATLKRKLIEQIGAATGGPQQYTGRNMKDAHRGLEITNADFNALVDDLEKTLKQNHVGAKEQDELKALLAPMRADVVEKRD